jgi:hypothetical protein
LHQLRELNAVQPEQAEVIQQLERDWHWPGGGRYPVRRGEAVEPIEGTSRQAAIEDARPAQDATAADPEAWGGVQSAQPAGNAGQETRPSPPSDAV